MTTELECGRCGCLAPITPSGLIACDCAARDERDAQRRQAAADRKRRRRLERIRVIEDERETT